MLNLILMSSSSILAMMFTQMKHPLALGLILLVQTLLIALISGLSTLSYWFSYILFLVFLGGMLVLFIYVTSLASNEMFSIPTLSLIFTVAPIVSILFISMFLDSSLWTSLVVNNDMSHFNDLTPTHEEAALPLIKLYNNPTSLITLMLALYLFLTLIAVIQITSIFNGPLRSNH
nr:NADH dehydrogenase subunit 6 [Flavoperla sp. YZD-2020]